MLGIFIPGPDKYIFSIPFSTPNLGYVDQSSFSKDFPGPSLTALGHLFQRSQLSCRQSEMQLKLGQPTFPKSLPISSQQAFPPRTPRSLTCKRIKPISPKPCVKTISRLASSSLPPTKNNYIQARISWYQPSTTRRPPFFRDLHWFPNTPTNIPSALGKPDIVPPINLL